MTGLLLLLALFAFRGWVYFSRRSATGLPAGLLVLTMRAANNSSGRLFHKRLLLNSSQTVPELCVERIVLANDALKRLLYNGRAEHPFPRLLAYSELVQHLRLHYASVRAVKG